MTKQTDLSSVRTLTSHLPVAALTLLGGHFSWGGLGWRGGSRDRWSRPGQGRQQPPPTGRCLSPPCVHSEESTGPDERAVASPLTGTQAREGRQEAQAGGTGGQREVP